MMYILFILLYVSIIYISLSLLHLIYEFFPLLSSVSISFTICIRFGIANMYCISHQLPDY